MSTYIAPIRDMQFILNEVAGLEEVCALPGNEECSVELVESILEEAAKFATGVLDPINRAGDSTVRSARTASSPPRPASRKPTNCSSKPAGIPCPFPGVWRSGPAGGRFDGSQ
jgi:hypothetical protein